MDLDYFRLKVYLTNNFERHYLRHIVTYGEFLIIALRQKYPCIVRDTRFYRLLAHYCHFHQFITIIPRFKRS